MSFTPEAAYKRLLEGNERFAKDELLHPRRDLFRREAITSQQEPFAIILTCSDSRVSPEIVFDQGLGDLFVVRVAGNVCGPLELDTIEFAAFYMHSPLILVLGHECCGAVHAVLNGNTKEIETLATFIEPATREAQLQEGDLLENSVKANVRNHVRHIKESSLIQRLINEGKVEVIGGYYNLRTGIVSILD